MGKTIYRKPRKLEISTGWKFKYEVCELQGDMVLILSLIYFTFYIHLPYLANPESHFGNERAWGFYWIDSSLCLEWGQWRKYLHMPWEWAHVRHEVLYPDGLRKPVGDSWDKEDGRVIETHPYTYTRKSGEVQEREATIYTEEREWRWRWFKWLPFPRRIRRSISIDFNQEIGERTGSWKGGVVGCGYSVKPGETPLETLRRMESERVFN